MIPYTSTKNPFIWLNGFPLEEKCPELRFLYPNGFPEEEPQKPLFFCDGLDFFMVCLSCGLTYGLMHLPHDLKFSRFKNLVFSHMEILRSSGR